MNALMGLEIAVLDSLWQAALLAGLAWLVLRFARRMNAATRFAIWWVVLGAALILPGAPRMAGMARKWMQPATIQAAHPRYAPVAPITFTEVPPLVTVEHRNATHWPTYVAALWCLILLCRLAQLAAGYLKVRGIKRRASVSSEPLPSTRRSASLLLSSEIDSPIAVGFARPAVILPTSLPAQLSREEMDHVLLHETAHLLRRDDWTNLVARVLDAALALHPVATWILRRIEIERENACDEWVVARTKFAQPRAEPRPIVRAPIIRSTGRTVGFRDF
jgi:beta-lactamase regulating signal transducer with metallopeptidase domain